MSSYVGLEDIRRFFKNLVLSDPALGISSLGKPFTLIYAERQGIALGVLIQRLGDSPQPVAYFYK